MKIQFYSILLKLLLIIHNWIYVLISKIAVRYSDGTHPKHEILKYETWFSDKINHEEKVLDIGSHSGGMCFILAQKAKQVVGIEIDTVKYQLAIKQNKFSNLSFINADATNWESDIKFDCITLSNVLEHIDERKFFLKKIIQKYCPQKILIRVPLITRDWLSVFKKQMGVDYRLDPTHFIEHTEEEIFNELIESGLIIKNYKVAFGEIFIECTPK